MELEENSLASSPNVNMSELLNMTSLQIIEEGPQVTQDFNIKDLTMLEEGPRICPVCSQEIRTYFINYTEKIEMCENLQCDYPFGYEPVKIIREENGVQVVEVKSVTSKGSRSMPGSQGSSQGWSDVDKLCRVFETDDVPSVKFNKPKIPAQLKKTESDRRREELLENVEKIKRMTKSMNNTKKDTKGIIKNEKWIKNLQYLQGLSGFNLLKPAEMKKLKKKEGASGSGELKINIDKNNLTNIKIEVNRRTIPNTKLV